MPSTVTETIGSGGDYATISGWLSGTSNDLVTADEVRVGKIVDNAAFNEASTITVSGATTDSTRYRHLTVDSSVRHDGTAGTGAEYSYTGGGHAFQLDEDHFEISWLDLSYASGGNNSDEIFRVNGDGVKIHHNLIHDVPHDNGGGIHPDLDGITVSVWNCIFYDINREAAGIQGQKNVLLEIINCTAYNCSIESDDPWNNVFGFGQQTFDHSGSQIRAQNTYGHSPNSDDNVFGVGTTANPGSYTADSDYNATYDGSAIGSNSLTNVTPSGEFQNLTDGSEDLHLQASSQLIDAGTDLGTDYNTDIDGQTRPSGSPWDIGADQTFSVATVGASRSFGFGLIG